ncbi:HAD family hydrolase [Amycolatopsis japonica]|uniref:HAD family hydrolase n=1 Tax=Amycolatopsis japonica TaxID=208439 RepID=UPI003830F759
MTPRILRAAPEGIARAAFFDVDETLLAVKTMFAFWRYWHERSGGGPDHATAELRRLAATGLPREVLNRRYYRRFQGVSSKDLMAGGLEWYREFSAGPAPFVTEGVAALGRHLADGDLVVLVSGSMPALIEPAAEELGAHVLCCTELLEDESGVLTGEVARPMIGSAKREAVLDVLSRAGLPAEDSHAYGDHASDLPMLDVVGHPVVVGDGDPELAAKAAARRWPVLSAAAGR